MTWRKRIFDLFFASLLVVILGPFSFSTAVDLFRVWTIPEQPSFKQVLFDASLHAYGREDVSAWEEEVVKPRRTRQPITGSLVEVEGQGLPDLDPRHDRVFDWDAARRVGTACSCHDSSAEWDQVPDFPSNLEVDSGAGVRP